MPREDDGLDFVYAEGSQVARWKIFLYLVRQITPQRATYVYPHYHTLEMLNNPAIEALIQYKW